MNKCPDCGSKELETTEALRCVHCGLVAGVEEFEP